MYSISYFLQFKKAITAMKLYFLSVNAKFGLISPSTSLIKNGCASLEFWISQPFVSSDKLHLPSHLLFLLSLNLQGYADWGWSTLKLHVNISQSAGRGLEYCVPVGEPGRWMASLKVVVDLILLAKVITLSECRSPELLSWFCTCYSSVFNEPAFILRYLFVFRVFDLWYTSY